MIRSVLSLTTAAAVCLLFLSGCEEKTPPPVAPSSTTKILTPAEKSAIPEVVDGENDVVAPEKYVYNPLGRRDPFQPLVVVEKKMSASHVSEAPLTPLQKFDLGQFKLIGIIVGKGESKAMVIAPDGKSYILKRGVAIGKNNGIVREIRPNSVLVKERYEDFTGAVRESDQEIQLPNREGVE
jgi:type IV pilus assembly protein PilP